MMYVMTEVATCGLCTPLSIPSGLSLQGHSAGEFGGVSSWRLPSLQHQRGQETAVPTRLLAVRIVVTLTCYETSARFNVYT